MEQKMIYVRQQLRRLFLGLTSLLVLGTSGTSIGAPAPAAKKWRVGNRINEEVRILSFDERVSLGRCASYLSQFAQKVPAARYDAPVIQGLFRKIWKSDSGICVDVSAIHSMMAGANKDNWYFPTEANRKKQDVWCLFDSDRVCTIIYDTNHTYDPSRNELGAARVCIRNIWGHNMLSVFEQRSEIPQFIKISDTVTTAMSDDDQAYIRTLLAVVNENLAYIGDIPFYKPDTQRSIVEFCNESGAKCIPEKYLLTGAVLDTLPSKFVDPTKIDLQKRLGYPIYDISDYECAEAWEASLRATGKSAVEAKKLVAERGPLTCDRKVPFSRYSNLRFVDSLVQFQGWWNPIDHQEVVLKTLREVQYKRAQASLKIIFNGLKEELTLQNNNPNRKKVLISIVRDVGRLAQKWDHILQEAMDQKKLLFSLTNPGGSREAVRVNALRTLTTWGTYKKIDPAKNWRRTQAENDAYWDEIARKRKERARSSNNQKTRGEE